MLVKEPVLFREQRPPDVLEERSATASLSRHGPASSLTQMPVSTSVTTETCSSRGRCHQQADHHDVSSGTSEMKVLFRTSGLRMFDPNGRSRPLVGPDDRLALIEAAVLENGECWAFALCLRCWWTTSWN